MELFPRSIGYLAFTVLHLLCFAFGIAVCGLYGRDISRASKHPDGYADGKWVYAVVVGAMSVVTSVVYWVPFVLRVSGVVMPVWNFVLFVLWSAVFGVFAKVRVSILPCSTTLVRPSTECRLQARRGG